MGDKPTAFEFGSDSSSSPFLEPSGKYKSFIIPEKYERSKKEGDLLSYKKDISRYEKDIKENQLKIIQKKALIANLEKELGSETRFKLTDFKLSSISPLVFPIVLSIIFSILALYDLMADKDSLGPVYNIIYQRLVTLIAGNIIMLLLMIFITSQEIGKTVNMISVIGLCGLSIILNVSVIDKIGKTYLLSNGKNITPSDYISSKWLYGNIFTQSLIIFGVIYYHDKIKVLDSVRRLN
jgi:hypothetical protein